MQVNDVSALDGAVTATGVVSWCVTQEGELTGGTTLANAVIAGDMDVPASPPPNTDASIPGLATIILNEQVLSEDEQTLTVNAIRIILQDGTQEVIVAQSVCTLAGDDGTTIPPVLGTPPPTVGTTPPTVGTTPPGGPTGPTGPTGGTGNPGAAPGATPVAGSPNFTG